MRRLAAVVLIAVTAALGLATGHAAGRVADTPPGATARCNDGTYSFSATHSGSCSHHGGVAQWLDGTTPGSAGGGSATGAAPTPAAASSGSPASLGATVKLGPQTATTGCVRGVVPDKRCSPGAYYSALTTAVICTSAFHTSDIRNVPQSEKYAVEREYGMPPGFYGRTIEIDHIIPLELGGSNDIANLFPEPGSGAAGYRAKDRLENKLHALVCGGQLTLSAVQAQITSDWRTLYGEVYGEAPRR